LNLEHMSAHSPYYHTGARAAQGQFQEKRNIFCASGIVFLRLQLFAGAKKKGRGGTLPTRPLLTSTHELTLTRRSQDPLRRGRGAGSSSSSSSAWSSFCWSSTCASSSSPESSLASGSSPSAARAAA